MVQSLVYILSGVFDATRDLYRTLSLKEQREYEQSLRSYSRRSEYVSDERLGSEEAIMTDKATMVRQFEIGYHAMGTEFAMGDGMHFSAVPSCAFVFWISLLHFLKSSIADQLVG